MDLVAVGPEYRHFLGHAQPETVAGVEQPDRAEVVAGEDPDRLRKRDQPAMPAIFPSNDVRDAGDLRRIDTAPVKLMDRPTPCPELRRKTLPTLPRKPPAPGLPQAEEAEVGKAQAHEMVRSRPPDRTVVSAHLRQLTEPTAPVDIDERDAQAHGLSNKILPPHPPDRPVWSPGAGRTHKPREIGIHA